MVVHGQLDEEKSSLVPFGKRLTGWDMHLRWQPRGTPERVGGPCVRCRDRIIATRLGQV